MAEIPGFAASGVAGACSIIHLTPAIIQEMRPSFFHHASGVEMYEYEYIN